MHEGHRARMVERMIKNAEGLQEHELLEILLFNAIPRKNTNEIAHRLLSRFGSIESVLNRELSELVSVEGIGKSTAIYLKTLGVCFNRLVLGGVCMDMTSARKEANSVEKFRGVLAKRYAGYEKEIIELFALDGKGRIFASQQYTANEKNMAYVSQNEVLNFLSQHCPQGLLVAHNHLTEGCFPSESDNDFTAQISMICSIASVVLYDHMIVSREGTYSYFSENNIDAIRNRFSVQQISMKTGMKR